jgi:hypothetical protein
MSDQYLICARGEQDRLGELHFRRQQLERAALTIFFSACDTRSRLEIIVIFDCTEGYHIT